MLKLLVKQLEANLRFVVINDVDLAESSCSVKLCCIQRTQLLWTSSSVYLKITPWLTVLFSATASSALTFLVVQVVQNLSVTGSFRGRWWRASRLILMLSWLKPSLFDNLFKEMFHTCSTQFPVKKNFKVGKDARNHVTDPPKASGFMSSYKSYNAIARTIYLMHLAVSSARKALKSKAWDLHRDHSRQLNIYIYTYHYYGYWAYQCSTYRSKTQTTSQHHPTGTTPGWLPANLQEAMNNGFPYPETITASGRPGKSRVDMKHTHTCHDCISFQIRLFLVSMVNFRYVMSVSF